MVVLVTGAAGFIGSNLAESLLAAGTGVRGIDALTANYPSNQKRRNMSAFADSELFDFHASDLASDDLAPLLNGVDAVVHLAGQPGVRTSWGDDFDAYVRNNVHATRRLLDVMTGLPTPPALVYCSTSAVYGNAVTFPVTESALPHPISPYGVSKLAAEQLCHAYAARFGFPLTTLRLFSVFGPRQRPDMALERLIRCALTGRPFPLVGDLGHVRDATFVGDVVDAIVLALLRTNEEPAVFNVAGGTLVTLDAMISEVESLVGASIPIERVGEPLGDAVRTEADTSLARAVLRWRPATTLHDGVARQIAWTQSLIRAGLS